MAFNNLTQERFYPIKGFPGYYLDDSDAVRSFKRCPLGHIIPWRPWKKKRRRKSDYVQLCLDGERVHRTIKQILHLKINMPLQFINGKFIPWEKPC